MNIVEWLALYFGKALGSDLGLDTDTHEGFMSTVSPFGHFSEQYFISGHDRFLWHYFQLVIY
jgi:hypothetical protein